VLKPTTASVEAIVQKMGTMSEGSVDEKAKAQVKAATGLDLTAAEVRRSPPPRGLRGLGKRAYLLWCAMVR
jgi:hypothetical protein